MATPCGGIDLGVLLHIMTEKGLAPDVVSGLLHDQSGLLGMSGVSADMREFLASSDLHSAEAVDLFVYRAVREIGSLTAAGNS